MAACYECTQEVKFNESGQPIGGIIKNKRRIVEKGIRPAVICIGCNRLGARISKAGSTDGSLKGALDSFEKDDRQKWFLEHQQTMGSDLNLALRTACRQTNSIANTEGFGGRGVWLDEADLAEKYKNKPEQLSKLTCAPYKWNIITFANLYANLRSLTPTYVGV